MQQRFESTRHSWAGGAVVILAIVIAMVAAAGILPPAAAQSEGTGRRCSDATLRGDYGGLAVGQRAVPPSLGGGIEQFVATSMWTFDGNGTLLIQGTGAGLHGEVTGIEAAHGGILGSYAVNENCTGTMQWQPPAPIPPIVYTFVIVDNAREVRAAVMSPLPNITSVELVRK